MHATEKRLTVPPSVGGGEDEKGRIKKSKRRETVTEVKVARRADETAVRARREGQRTIQLHGSENSPVYSPSTRFLSAFQPGATARSADRRIEIILFP